MKQIGGFFPMEPCLAQENHFLEQLVPEHGDIRLMMSGRCGNYYALQDISLSDKKKVAYVPVYTCETVLAPFEKAGFEMLFYQVDRSGLTPVFDPAVLDRISVISICGYYGFSSYDQDFVRQCHERGIIVLEDTTHSIFSSDGISPYCDYIVGSLRKWIGVPAGGFAIKVHGTFSLPVKSPDRTHLSMRADSMRVKQALEHETSAAAEAKLAQATAQFWDAEMMLRKIFDAYAADAESIQIMKHFDREHVVSRRRANYRYLAAHFPKHPQFTVIEPELDDGTVPSHFTIYVKDRDIMQDYLKKQGISTTAYWPQSCYVEVADGSDSQYIYQHVLSLPCDQRYHEDDMEQICRVIADAPEHF